MQDLPQPGTGRVDTYVQTIDFPTGWGWVALLGYSDILSLGALVVLVSFFLAGSGALDTVGH